MKRKLGLFALVIALLSTSCSDENDAGVEQQMTSELTLDFERLESLGPDFLYEGWIIVDGQPISTGTFSVDPIGIISKTQFTVDAELLSNATKFVLSIEPNPDPSPLPAETKLFTGNFSENSAILFTGTVASFSDISGKFILGAPTGTGVEEEKYSGIWFLDNSSGTDVEGLKLPVLEAGWQYEGWAVIEGLLLSTGKFISTSGSDDEAPFSGVNPGPLYPGEDFLENAPQGLEFPEDLRGRFVIISVEPFPDNSPTLFTMKPLAGRISDVTGVQQIGINVVASFPSGRAIR